MDTWHSVLRRLAWTLAIVAPLGIVLYLAIRYLAEGLAEAQYWLTIGLVVPFAVLLIDYLFGSFRTGRLPLWRSEILRVKQPVSYWFWMSWFGLMVALSLCLCLYAIGNLGWID